MAGRVAGENAVATAVLGALIGYENGPFERENAAKEALFGRKNCTKIVQQHGLETPKKFEQASGETPYLV